jgi:gas vesicle protein
MILGKIKGMMLGAAGFLAIIFAAYVRGRQAQADKIVRKQLETYQETRERIDEASSVKRDADDAREWLRNRNK